MLTRAGIKAYIRTIVGEFDSNRINEDTLNADINLTQRNIQMNTLEIGGVKQYTKIAYGSQNIVELPSDLLFHPNAIIDVEASTGTRGGSSVNTGNGSIVFLLSEPTTDAWGVTFQNESATDSVTVSPSTKIVTIFYQTGVSTVTTILAVLNASMLFRQYFIEATGSTTGTGVITLNTTVALSAGVGTGWKYAEEKSIREFNRVKNRQFQASEAEPFYRRLGDAISNQVMEFTPSTITFSKVYYHYLLADLTSDTETLKLPPELEELALIDLQRRVYIYLNKQQNTAEQNADYMQKLQSIDKKYSDGLAVAVGDSRRISQTEA